MTIQQLKYILGVAEYGSINKTAEKLYVSQPSITSSIRDAEAELGFKIFDRSSRGVTLNEQGENFVRDAGIVLEKFNSLLKKYSRNEKKSFSVAALYYSFARKAFVEVVKKFSEDNYDFSFREIVAESVIEDVAGGKSNLGIIYLSETNRDLILKSLEANKLTFNHLTECNAFVYMHKNHPLAEKEAISLEELSKFQFVTFDTDDLKSFFSEETIIRCKLKNPIMVSDRATELNLIKNLNGYTFLSGVSGEDTSDDFITIPLKDHDDAKTGSFELGYITQKDKKLNNISTAYINAIRRILKIDHEE